MYLNVIQLAESLGVAESVVETWVRNESLPCIHDRERLLFDRAQVVAWATTCVMPMDCSSLGQFHKT